jgi:hypothetical protein
MHARPLPIRHIGTIVGALGVLSVLAQFFGMRWLHGIAFILGFLAIATLLSYHAYVDNIRTKYRNLKLVETLAWTFLVWIPFLVLLVPGVVVTLKVDNMIDAALRKFELMAADTVQKVDKEVEEVIRRQEAVPLSWWWPPDWAKSSWRTVEIKTTRIVQEDVLQKSSMWLRGLFAVIYAIMRISQLLLYSSFAFITIRSFLFLLARAALWNDSEIEFSLP